jgi:protocatechuate 3,4-dioxygenase beta subunit
MNRRNLFKIAASGAGLIMAGKSNAADLCATPTKEQTEGPFYPKDWNAYEADADMSYIEGKSSLADGQLTFIEGQVIDSETCEPIAHSQVDVWQANAYGQYFHERDASEAELKDKNFQYRCRIITDEEGRFSFKTIKPSPYPAGGSWIRPPHIHFKVIAADYQELTTQMYFDGDVLNGADRILNSMTSDEQKSVIATFKEDRNKVLRGKFDISLKPDLPS